MAFNQKNFNFKLASQKKLGNKKLEDIIISKKNGTQITQAQLRAIWEHTSEKIKVAHKDKQPQLLVRVMTDRGISTLKNFSDNDINLMDTEDYLRGRVDDVDVSKYSDFNWIQIIVKVNA
jgi:hypothetical protein